MLNLNWRLRLVALVVPIATTCSTLNPALAQITPDASLGTTMTGGPTSFTIENGTTSASGTNLFHSFSEFSIPNGWSVTFDNALTIQNIFTRVTGGNISVIDGAIAAQGTANLFLINPAGIHFGPNATLNIGGSFFASTASSVLFDNGVAFSPSTTAAPLLTVNSPVGLDMGANPGAGKIRVEGPGHGLFYTPTDNVFLPLATPTLSALDPTITPYVHGGLKVNPGNTLALISNEVTLDGGLVTAERGRIEVGAVTSGTVGLNQASPTLWTANYRNATANGAILFQDRALTDVSDDVAGVLGGLGGGSMQIAGGTVTLREGAIALNQTVGVVPGGSITVTANALKLIDPDPATLFTSQILTETLDTFGTGSSGDIAISTDSLVLESARIATRTFGTVNSGELSIQVSSSIQMSPTSLGKSSLIMSQAGGSGRSGDLNVTASSLSAVDGSAIVSAAFGSGDSGDATVNITDITLVGADPVTLSQSSLSNFTQSSGDSGNLTVNTARLRLINGGRVDASTIGPGGGSGGNLIVNASEFVEVSGFVDGTGAIAGFSNPSQIIAGADVISIGLQIVLGLPPLPPTGDSGNVTIRTPELRVSNQGLVTVGNEGSGNGGTLRIEANQILLDQRGGITASTLSGEGGNIDLKVGKAIVMRRGSFISAEAGGTGNGGNITINAPFIVAVPGENSDIIANAFRGNGGNITITTQGILGLEFRDQLTEFSDITASSQFGISGTVTISNPSVNPTGLDAELQGEVLDPNQQVDNSCAAVGSSTFTVMGRGGLPDNPTAPRPGQSVWSDLRDLSAFRRESNNSTASPSEQSTLVEATGLRVRADGTVELFAENPSASGAFAAVPNCEI